MTEIEHEGVVAMEATPAPQSSQAEFFRLIAKHYMNALESIVTEATNLETCHRLACEALGSPPPARIEPAINDLVGRLRRYRPRDEFGDPVKHTICDEAADEIERLRTPAPQDHLVALTDALTSAAKTLDIISCVPNVTETTDAYDQLQRAKFFADRGASAAWSVIRSLPKASKDAQSVATEAVEYVRGYPLPEVTPENIRWRTLLADSLAAALAASEGSAE